MATTIDPYSQVPAGAPIGEATAAADPSVAIMRAAASKHQRDMEAFQQKQAMEAAQEQRAKASSALAQAHDTHLVNQDTLQANQQKMLGDIAVSQPAYGGGKVRWDNLDPSTPQSFVDRYGIENMGAARTAWDSHIPKPNRVLDSQLSKAGVVPPLDATDEEKQTIYAEHQQQAAKTAQEAKEKISEGAQRIQGQRLLTQILRSSQNNQQVKGYQSARTNFDSVQRNVANPVRSGADDVFLLQAAATMENPTRSTTAADIKEFMAARGIKGNLNTLADRYGALINQSPEAQQRQGRILDDATVRQIADSARRSVQARRESLTEIMTPFVNRMEDLGEDPYRHFPKELVDDVYHISDQQGPQPNGQTQLSESDQAALEWANANPQDPRAARIKAMHGVR